MFEYLSFLITENYICRTSTIPTAFFGSPVSPELAMNGVPNDFICMICRNIAWQPIETTCHHIFCLSCVDFFTRRLTAEGKAHKCPECRAPIKSDGSSDKLLREVNPALSRVYDGIKVRCEHYNNGCQWQGRISEVKDHHELCTKLPVDITTYKSMKKELEHARQEINALRHTLQASETKEEGNQKGLRVAGIETKQKQGEESTVDQDSTTEYVRSIDSILTFEGVSILTRLIRQHFPDGFEGTGVDRNKVFDHITAHHSIACRRLRGEPPGYIGEVLMLLGTAYGSSLFTSHQNAAILRMMNEIKRIAH